MINLKTTENSIKLLTAGKFCDDDINVTFEGGSSGTPIELATSEEMEAVLVAENIGKIYKFVGETNETFTNGNLYQVMEVDE